MHSSAPPHVKAVKISSLSSIQTRPSFHTSPAPSACSIRLEDAHVDLFAVAVGKEPGFGDVVTLSPRPLPVAADTSVIRWSYHDWRTCIYTVEAGVGVTTILCQAMRGCAFSLIRQCGLPLCLSSQCCGIGSSTLHCGKCQQPEFLGPLPTFSYFIWCWRQGFVLLDLF